MRVESSISPLYTCAPPPPSRTRQPNSRNDKSAPALAQCHGPPEMVAAQHRQRHRVAPAWSLPRGGSSCCTQVSEHSDGHAKDLVVSRKRPNPPLLSSRLTARMLQQQASSRYHRRQRRDLGEEVSWRRCASQTRRDKRRAEKRREEKRREEKRLVNVAWLRAKVYSLPRALAPIAPPTKLVAPPVVTKDLVRKLPFVGRRQRG